mmetsp:Transcript_25993/g.46188  ORF Transcript_25993/g.46188 Transcript_25993/m.46188 type:complete len:186 (+) Transcript_25993:116-673(+)
MKAERVTGSIFGFLGIGIIAATAHCFLQFFSRPFVAQNVVFLATAFLVHQTFVTYAKAVDKIFWLLFGVTSPLCAIFVGYFLGLLSNTIFVLIVGCLIVVGCTLFAYLSAVVGNTRNVRIQEFLMLVGLLMPAVTAIIWLVSRHSVVYRAGIVLSVCCSSINILFNKVSGSALYGLPDDDDKMDR